MGKRDGESEGVVEWKCVSERERDYVSECVCVGVREIQRECVCVRERYRECVCV